MYYIKSAAKDSLLSEKEEVIAWKVKINVLLNRNELKCTWNTWNVFYVHCHIYDLALVLNTWNTS